MDFKKILEGFLVMAKPEIKKVVEEKFLAPSEKKIKESNTQIDNIFLLPLIAEARKALAAW